MTTNDTRLKVAIVGSGIAGLAAARILREKHNVTVYERGEASITIGGQGIANFPNSTHILNSMGFDYKRVGSVEIGNWHSVDKRGKALYTMDYDMKERYGAPLVTHLRVDVRAELLRLATAPPEDLGLDASAAPAKTIWENGVVDLDAESGRITLAAGNSAEADVVIVADGIHSRLREKFLGTPNYARKTGMTCCRLAISAEQTKAALGKLPHWWQNQLDKKEGHMRLYDAVDGTSRLLTVYPLRDGTWMNMSWVFPTKKESESTTVSWNTEGDRDEISTVFHDFDEDLKKMLHAATEVKQGELQDLEPLPKWTSGRAILIGDAAHAMTPLQGQGSNMAIEDADGLRLLIQSGVTRDNVPQILEKIESIRRPRAARVLMNTRSTSRVSSAADRYAKFDDNCTYPGILSIVKEQAAKI